MAIFVWIYVLIVSRNDVELGSIYLLGKSFNKFPTKWCNRGATEMKSNESTCRGSNSASWNVANNPLAEESWIFRVLDVLPRHCRCHHHFLQNLRTRHANETIKYAELLAFLCSFTREFSRRQDLQPKMALSGDIASKHDFPPQWCN